MRFFSSLTVRRRVTVAVWLLGMMFAAALIARRPTSQIRGLAWAEPFVLEAPSSGTPLTLSATLHDTVMVDDVVLQLDPAALIARRRILLAEIDALAESASEDQQDRTRLLQRDVERASLELGQLRARIEESQAELAALREELAIEERLFEQGVAPQEKMQAVRREINVVEARLSADRRRVALAGQGAGQAESRARSAAGSRGGRIEIVRRELEEIDQRIDSLTLRSKVSGQITEMFLSPGEWVTAGDAIVRISPVVANEIHAWLDTPARPDLGAGAAAQIRRIGGPALSGRVRSVGVERLELPRSLWERSDAPKWGYLMVIDVAESGLTPGEPVVVGLKGAAR